MFEPAFVKKPVFLFATDRKEYIDKEYDLLIDYDTLPFPIAESNEELARNIENFNQAEYEKKLDAFMEKYGVHEDGHASERAAEFISGLIDKGA
jgi:CDP-glycerol glycerophosphotransferase (TagB/SpsB family)